MSSPPELATADLPSKAAVEGDLRSLLAGFKRRKSKAPILERISTMRRGRGKEDGAFEAYFDVVLSIVDSSSSPNGLHKASSVLPFPFLHVPSYRVNLRLLRAVLALTEDADPTQASRRQNVAITLNQLKKL